MSGAIIHNLSYITEKENLRLTLKNKVKDKSLRGQYSFKRDGLKLSSAITMLSSSAVYTARGLAHRVSVICPYLGKREGNAS